MWPFVVMTTSVLAAATAMAGPPTTSPRRAMPDYDGRGNQHDDHDAALLAPRILLWPLYAVAEYVVRRPLGALYGYVESHHHAEAGAGGAGRGHHVVVFPLVHYDHGQQATLGVYTAAEHVLHDGNSVRASAATGGLDRWRLAFADRLAVGDAATAAVALDVDRRADLVFFGLGPEAATYAHYGRQRIEGGPAFADRIAPPLDVAAAAGVRHVGYRAGCCGMQLGDAVASGAIALPADFERAYTVAYQRARVAVDSRRDGGGGAYLALAGETDLGLGDPRRWIHYGGAAGATADLTGHRRLVELAVAVDFVDPLRGGDPPFDALASLGGDAMQGFIDGWMTGRSTAMSSLAYTWPVWTKLDGELRVAAGNAFGAHLEGLTTGALRLSGSLGVRTPSPAQDYGFELLVGAGTETIEDGAHVTSVRISLGTRSL